MKLGFTGTRDGMTEPQRITVLELIKRFSPREAHHGDCVGADEQFHDLCDQLNPYRAEDIWIVTHPPRLRTLRAFCEGHEERPAKDYMPRNFDIVDECEVLIIAPKQERKPAKLKGSGTWQTEDYAERKRREVYIVYPSGKIEPVELPPPSR